MTRANPAARALALLGLALIFFRELWLSSVSVARAAFAPEIATRPAIVAVPVALTSDVSIAVLANLVTLTPGTCSLHVSQDRRTLFVHAFDCENEAAVVASIDETFARPLARIEGSAA